MAAKVGIDQHAVVRWACLSREPGRREETENPEQSGSQGWDVFPLLPGILLEDFLSTNRFMKPLGICWIAYGIFRICAGVALVLFAPTATVMFGALLGRVADPFTLMSAFHFLYIIAVVLSFICGLLGIFGGLAIYRNAKTGRGLLILASLLALMNIPLGVALGVYTLVALFPSHETESAQAS